MAATETPSEIPTVESLTGRASGVPTPEVPTVESLTTPFVAPTVESLGLRGCFITTNLKRARHSQKRSQYSFGNLPSPK